MVSQKVETKFQDNSIVYCDEEKGVNSALESKAPVSHDSPASDAFTIPDGGWRAWSVVFGCALVLFSTFGYVSSISRNLKAVISKRRCAGQCFWCLSGILLPAPW